MNENELVKAAIDSMGKAYAPYSGFKVGAALLTDSGRLFTGANIENASYGASICAERAAVYAAVLEGERKFRAIAVAGGSDKPVYPCGICRQVIAEFAEKDALKVICANREGKYEVYMFDELLPNSFRLE